MTPKDLSPYSLTDLMALTELPFDIYLRLSSGRTVKVGKKGQAVLQESLARYLNKGANHVLVEASALKALSDPPPKEAPPPKKDLTDTTDLPPQLRLLMTQSQGIYENLHLLGFQPEALEEASDVAQKASRFLNEQQDLFYILDKLKFFDNPIAAHSLAVGTSAVMIAKSQGWLHPSNFQKLFLGGLLHDIGLMMLPQELQSKLPDEMSPKELEIYKTHPALGFKSLSRIPDTPKEVLSIVLEHHEGLAQAGPR